jgi:hypothetical protein
MRATSSAALPILLWGAGMIGATLAGWRQASPAALAAILALFSTFFASSLAMSRRSRLSRSALSAEREALASIV